MTEKKTNGEANIAAVRKERFKLEMHELSVTLFICCWRIKQQIVKLDTKDKKNFRKSIL